MILTAYATDTYIPQGTTRSLRMQIQTEEGNDYNLTGHSVYMVFSNLRSGIAPVLQKEATIITATEGKISFDFDPEDTINLLSIGYPADVWVIHDSTGDKWPAWSGRIGITAIIPLEEV